jgi:hypothetical protein
MEGDDDRKIKKSQTQEYISVRWDMGLNKKRLAYFYLPKANEGKKKNKKIWTNENMFLFIRNEINAR